MCIHIRKILSLLAVALFPFMLMAEDGEKTLLDRLAEKYGMHLSGFTSVPGIVSVGFDVQGPKEIEWLRKVLIEADRALPLTTNQIIIFVYTGSLSRVAELSDGRLCYQTYTRDYETEVSESYEEAIRF